MFKREHRSEQHLPWKQIVVGGGMGAVGMIFAVALYIVEALIRPKRYKHFIESYTFSPYELGIPFEKVTFAPLAGKHLVSGWYMPYPQATTTILVCPGYRSRISDVLGTCAHLWRAGHNVLAFEYYGHGAVVGKEVTLGYREINDFMGAISYAQERAPRTRLGAVGYSMGAAVTIMASARTSAIEAIVADSSFATHHSVLEYAVRRTLHMPFALFGWCTDLVLWLRAGYHVHQVEPLRDIARIAPRPILLIQSLKDSIVNPHDAPRLYKAAGDPKELWLVDATEHCGAYFADRVAYVNRLVAFFEQALKKNRTPLNLQERQTMDNKDTMENFLEAS